VSSDIAICIYYTSNKLSSLHTYFESQPRNKSAGNSSHVNAGAIAGGVIGGIAVLAILVLAGLFWRRRKTKAEEQPEDKVRTSDHYVDPFAFEYAPIVAHGSDRSSTALDTPRTTGWATATGKREFDHPPPLVYPDTANSSQSLPMSSNGASGDELRDQVERLRREMDEVKASGQVYEAPPRYGASQHGD
jgi:hypothetical protein